MTEQISTKLGTRHPWVREFPFIQMKGIALFQGEIHVKAIQQNYIDKILKYF